MSTSFQDGKPVGDLGDAARSGALPGVFGHRVPQDPLANLAPGVALPVAVNPANPNQECAIDWATAPR
jgi:hypothetical protein